MAINGWEHYDLEQELHKSSPVQVLAIYKRETEKYNNKCTELVSRFNKVTEKEQSELEAECHHLNEARCKVALKLADMLTKTKGGN